MAGILGGVRSVRRKSLRRKPTSPMLEGEEFESDGPATDAALLDAEAEQEHRRVLAALEEELLESSEAGVSPKIFAGMSLGLRGHEALAAHAGCAREQVENAVRRIMYRCKVLRERLRKEAEAS